jgi:hypothetical protein
LCNFLLGQEAQQLKCFCNIALPPRCYSILQRPSEATGGPGKITLSTPN